MSFDFTEREGEFLLETTSYNFCKKTRLNQLDKTEEQHQEKLRETSNKALFRSVFRFN